MERRSQPKLPEIKRVPPLFLSCSDSKSRVDWVWIPDLTLNNYAVFWQITQAVMLSFLICEMGMATSNVWSVARLCIKWYSWQPRAPSSHECHPTWVPILVLFRTSFETVEESLTLCMSQFPLLKNRLKRVLTSSDYQWVGWWWRVWPRKWDHLDVIFSSVLSHLCDLGRFIQPLCASVLTSLKWEPC